MSTRANVNKPTNTKLKEEDVNRKLQVYGIISAFQNGKVPSNQQIDVALNSFLASKALTHPSNRLSEEGKALIADVKEVVKQAKLLLLSKNHGNLLQDFIWQTTQFDPNAVSTPNAPVDKNTAKQHGDQALEGLRTLGTLIITNGQFRKLLNDAVVLLRDVGADAATNAAGKVRPSDEKLNQIDRPADDNTWHDAPDFSKENIKSQAQGVYKGNAKEDVKGALKDATSAAHPSGSSDPKDLADTHPSRLNQGEGANAGINSLKERADDKLDPETKDKVKDVKETAQQKKEEYRHRTKNYLKEKMPEERRDQTIWRLKKMVIECQQHPDYQQAISTLLDLAEEYGSHANRVAKESGGTVQETRSGLKKAEADLRTLIERFANGTSSEDLWDSINTIYKDADRDPELKDWFRAMNKYIRRCLQEQGYILEDESTQQWNRLYDHGNYLLRDKYRGHTDRIVDEIKFLADQFDQDSQNKAFGNAVQKLFLNLGNDENGKPTFKPHLVTDLKDVILLAMFETAAYIPIPRIEYSDPQADAVIENLILESDNFLPNVFEVANENYLRWDRKTLSNKNFHSIEIKVAGVQMDLRDVSYYVKKKQGFPSLTDTGIVDVLLPGNGFSFKIKLSTADAKDKQNFFKVDKVDVDFKTLNLKVKKSNHKLLFSLFKPIALKVLRVPIQKAVEKAIKDKINEFDSLLYGVKLEADRAVEEAADNPENASNIYQRYVNAAQKKVMQGKKKAENVAADKKVNMAVTKEDSIFPQVHLPGGISSKATEYKELGRKGDRWESQVFSIGSAAPSSNIPSPPQITRKPHSTASPANIGSGSATHSSGLGSTGSGLNTSSSQGYGGQYGSSTTGGQLGSSNTGDQYGSSTTGGQYDSSTTSGQYGSGNTGAQYGSSNTGAQHSSSNTGGQYDSSNTGAQYDSTAAPVTGGTYGHYSANTVSQYDSNTGGSTNGFTNGANKAINSAVTHPAGQAPLS